MNFVNGIASEMKIKILSIDVDLFSFLFLIFMNAVILPTGSLAPNTDEKLLSETNALDCVAGAKSIKYR